MSVVVTMELLKHFDETDPHFKTCFKGLALQYFHTQSKAQEEPGNNIKFIPPLNTLLAKHYFGQNTDLFKYYVRIIEIASEAAKDLELLAFKKDENDIEMVRRQLIYERTEIQQNLEDFIKGINGGVADWELFKNDKVLRKKLLNEIRAGHTKKLLAASLCKRAHSLLDLPYPQQGLDMKFADFLNYYEPLLYLNQTIIVKLIHGVQALSDPLSEKWNMHNDIQILGAACFNSYIERNNDVRTIIITDDNAIHLACKNTYMQDNVWTLKKYFSFIY